MGIKFINAEDYSKTIKASIHRSGKLGFSEGAIKMLGLDDKKSIRFGVDAEDEAGDSFYLLVIQGEEKGAFKVYRAGSYFYINTRNFFDFQGIDYKNKNEQYVFNITELKMQGQKIYKLNRRNMKLNQ